MIASSEAISAYDHMSQMETPNERLDYFLRSMDAFGMVLRGIRPLNNARIPKQTVRNMLEEYLSLLKEDFPELADFIELYDIMVRANRVEIAKIHRELSRLNDFFLKHGYYAPASY